MISYYQFIIDRFFSISTVNQNKVEHDMILNCKKLGIRYILIFKHFNNKIEA